ncbi:MAG: ATP-binding cassette domain-containing protein [Prevotellaceae bacterium]|jgi:ABC-type lipoprotein export system ATPase subunit|nr:ATP-binding cassette domain-containing protein [Prevotellaceae bacterium]
MNTLSLKHTLPVIFFEAGMPASEIWLKEVGFIKGRLYLITAASGVGKSSLLNYIFGERTDYTGDIFFDDRNINTLRPSEWLDIRQRRLGFIFQGLRLFTDLTVKENIDLKNRLTGFKSKTEINDLLEQTDIADKAGTKIRFLSFGQQQRVAIIRALCQPFDFLLMDEPFSHLDEQNVALLSSIITAELQRQGSGLLITSLGTQYPFNYHSILKL